MTLLSGVSADSPHDKMASKARNRMIYCIYRPMVCKESVPSLTFN
jgi:hypothetical protein